MQGFLPVGFWKGILCFPYSKLSFLGTDRFKWSRYTAIHARDCIFVKLAKITMKTATIFIAFLVFAGCSKSTQDHTIAPEIDYCPTAVGCWIDYSVTAITVDAASDKYDTARYILREEVDAVLDSSHYEQKYRIVRKIRPSQADNWQDFDALLVIKNYQMLIRQENNVPLISISYPVTLRKNWNGNALNTLDPADFEYSQVLAGQSYSASQIDSVLTVVQADKQTLIDIHYVSEKYAAGIGLVEKQSTAAYSGKDPILGSDGKPLPLLQRAETAVIYSQMYLAHGKK